MYLLQVFFVNSNQMQSWESDLLAFIKVLIERKCFGLGIKIGRHIPYIPSELIEYCNKKGFLIISLNNEYPWTEYLGEITNTINKFRNQEIEALNNVYNKFHTYLKERKKIDSLAEILYKIIGIPLTIYLKGLNIRIDYPEKFEHDLELDYLITTVFSGIGNEIEEVRYKKY
ncbi:PucR family transcriptional regulator ligand-binding domain-containing protein [Lysinibacillus sp. MHQ-1]|nr:PucR family transcriptional regulator ligand-binding domain-containing protein [Lysinibacillus sp. MHQ-1]